MSKRLDPLGAARLAAEKYEKLLETACTETAANRALAEIEALIEPSKKTEYRNYFLELPEFVAELTVRRLKKQREFNLISAYFIGGTIWSDFEILRDALFARVEILKAATKETDETFTVGQMVSETAVKLRCTPGLKYTNFLPEIKPVICVTTEPVTPVEPTSAIARWIDDGGRCCDDD